MAGPVVVPGAEEELQHFMRLPWCRQQLLEKGAVAVPRLDQEKDGRGSTGRLFSQTLNTPATISHRIVLFQDPSLGQLNPDSKKNWLPLNTCTVFYQLGEGVCGFGDICHGGIQCALLDDVMGVLGGGQRSTATRSHSLGDARPMFTREESRHAGFDKKYDSHARNPC